MSTKGKPKLKGNSFSVNNNTSTFSFLLVGKRSELGSFNNRVQASLREQGVKSSSLKSWEVKFGKGKLVVGSVGEGGMDTKGRISDGKGVSKLAVSGSQARESS